MFAGIDWKRSDPWLTSLVGCTPGRPGARLGLRPTPPGACVRDSLGVRSDVFGHQVETVVIYPSAPYAFGIRPALPGVQIAIDKWHLPALADTMVTAFGESSLHTITGLSRGGACAQWSRRRGAVAARSSPRLRRCRPLVRPGCWLVAAALLGPARPRRPTNQNLSTEGQD